MKWCGGRRVRWVCAVAAFVLTLVSFIANSMQIAQDKQKVAKMTVKMKTVCVGRFLIDVPEAAIVTVGRGSVSGFDISSTTRESDGEFAARLQRSEAGIREKRNGYDRPSLEVSKALGVAPAWGKLFIYNRSRSEGRENGQPVFGDNVSVRSMLRFPGLSITGSIDWIDPDKVGIVAGVMEAIRPLARGAVPQDPGFCLADAIILDPYDHGNVENVVMIAGIPGHPDVNIAFSSMSGTAPAPGLLERNADAAAREPAFMRMAFTALREHARAINGLHGEELVMRVREPNFTTGYSFNWEMAGKRDDVYAPLLTLELESGINPVAGGKPVQSTLSEEAMFDLWERIASSIRVRPNGPPSHAAQQPATAALGTSALAGDICPQSGWWSCSDGGGQFGVYGGERQYLKQGQRVPQALLLPQQTMWQRLRGLQPTVEHHHPTLWTLSDKRRCARTPQPPGLDEPIPATDAATVGAAPMPATHLRTPVGSVAKTGMVCPASGWWRCEDGHALDATRWFAAGCLLPAATFCAPQHERSGVHPGLIHRRSAWQLVRSVDDHSPPSVAPRIQGLSGGDDQTAC